jgi:hypothetical protein
VAQVVQCLPSKCEALSSRPRTICGGVTGKDRGSLVLGPHPERGKEQGKVLLPSSLKASLWLLGPEMS